MPRVWEEEAMDVGFRLLTGVCLQLVSDERSRRERRGAFGGWKCQGLVLSDSGARCALSPWPFGLPNEGSTCRVTRSVPVIGLLFILR